MKNFIISVLSLSFLISCSSGVGGEDSIEPNNSINEQWTQTFGGADREYGHSVQQTQDGGYIITGSTSSFGNGDSDVYLIKTDSNGNELWTQTFGGIDREYGHSVQQTQDGGYIITGYYYNLESLGTNNNGNSVSQIFQDIYLIKTDGSGNEIWSKTFEGLGNDLGNSVQQTNDGGYIITGSTYYFSNGELGEQDIYLIKTDINGNEIWSKTFGETDSEYGSSVQQTNDGGYIITGSTISNSLNNWDSDVYLIKTDINGNEIWSKTFGGTGFDSGSSVQQTQDGGYIITGSTSSFGNGNEDVWLIKTNIIGNEIWSKTFGGTGFDSGSSVQQTQDGGYIITGSTYSFESNEDVWLIKTNINGNEIWSKTFGGTGFDSGSSAQQTQDEGYIITGSTSSFGNGNEDVYLIKTDGQGNITSVKEIPLLNTKRKLEKTINSQGQEVKHQINQPIIEIYDDCSVEKKVIIE